MRTPWRHLWVFGLATLVGGSGILHLAAPEGYRRMVPRVLGHAPEIVAVSGVCEIACAALLFVPATRRLGGLATAALLVAVFPANVQMALDGGIPGAGFPLGNGVVAWLRLPLQIPLVWTAIAVGRKNPLAPRADTR